MNSLLLISVYNGSTFKPILYGNAELDALQDKLYAIEQPPQR
jgi:hypothetical protein